MSTKEFNYLELTPNELVSIYAGSEFSEAIVSLFGTITGACKAFFMGAQEASYAQWKCM